MASQELDIVDFSTFIVSLASNVMVNLGVDAEDGESQANFALAQQTIDILALLEEKTQGNLTEDEDKLLKGVLYQVRMAYVSKV
jgi:hypothetical protein